MIFRPLGTELYQVDGQTDRQTDRHMKELIVTFRNFANVPEIKEG